MLNVERLMGWICLAMSMALVFPNGSRLYEFLHILNFTVPMMLIMFIVGSGMIYASVTGYMRLRMHLMTANTAIWIAIFAIMYDNGLGYGPMAAASIVMIVHSVLRFADLRYALNNPEKPRLR